MSSRKRTAREEEEEEEEKKKRRFDEALSQGPKNLKRVLMELVDKMTENFKNFQEYMNQRLKEFEFMLKDLGAQVKEMELRSKERSKLALKEAEEEGWKPKNPYIPDGQDNPIDRASFLDNVENSASDEDASVSARSMVDSDEDDDSEIIELLKEMNFKF